MPDSPAQPLDPEVLKLLRCPLTRSALTQVDGELVAEEPAGAGLRYPIREGIPVLLMEEATLPEGVESLDDFKAKHAAAIDENNKSR
ncbi:MAG: Trm112 family protein [Phycisphaeraceae bacterium]